MSLKVFEAFAGYGSQSIALRNLGIDHEVVAISEIDKYAIKAYEAIHGKVKNLGNIAKINLNDVPKHDLFTYSFPCQDISVAGNMKGLIKGQTRSGLLYECKKIIEYSKPKYLLMENVKNLVSKKFKPQFDEWLKYLESLGYTNYWEVLNAKDYGMPQNRERVFVISILGEHKPYVFPQKVKLEKNVKDLLDNKVEQKYYLSDELVKKFVPNKKFHFSEKNSKIIEIGFIKKHENCKRHQSNTVVDENHLMKTLTASDYIHPPLIMIHKTNKHGLDYQIRKITAKECLRFMGLNENDIQKIIETGLSNTQQYKIAGNSIVVNVLEAIFKELFISNK